MLTPVTLREIMPRNPDSIFWSDVLGACLKYAEANTVPRAAALLAQLAHESGDCVYMRELGDGRNYERRADLGNVNKGDGPRYKGRGLIQLTGRKNYRAAGRAIGLDLEMHPEEAETARVAGSIAAWYWTNHGCNELADVYDFEGITKEINGGLNGWDQRCKYYVRALRALSRGKV